MYIARETVQFSNFFFDINSYAIKWRYVYVLLKPMAPSSFGLKSSFLFRIVGNGTFNEERKTKSSKLLLPVIRRVRVQFFLFLVRIRVIRLACDEIRRPLSKSFKSGGNYVFCHCRFVLFTF